MNDLTPEERAKDLLDGTLGRPSLRDVARVIHQAVEAERQACARIANGLQGDGAHEKVLAQREKQLEALAQKRHEQPREYFDGPSTKEEILEYLERTVHVVGRFVRIGACQVTFANPEDVPRHITDEIDDDGWMLVAEREYQLGIAVPLQVSVGAGAELQTVLDELDYIRRALVRRPDLISGDWTRPLRPRKTGLRVVPEDS